MPPSSFPAALDDVRSLYVSIRPTANSEFNKANMNPVVTIFGSYKPKPGDSPYQHAYELGRALGSVGLTVCNGGYAGVMEASARGAVEVGAGAIGVTCPFRGRSPQPNRYITDHIATGSLTERLDQLIQRASGFVVLAGGTGTLVELALVMELINKKEIAAAPVVLADSMWHVVADAVAHEMPAANDWMFREDEPQRIAALLSKQLKM